MGGQWNTTQCCTPIHVVLTFLNEEPLFPSTKRSGGRDGGTGLLLGSLASFIPPEKREGVRQL